VTNAQPADPPKVQQNESSTKLEDIRKSLKHALDEAWKHWKYFCLYLAGILICLALGRALWKYPTWRIPTSVVGVCVVLILILWRFPKWQVACLTELKPEKRFDRENAARQTISQIVGGLVLLIGFYFTWQSLVATQANLKIASEGQITDRFTKAIEQLGAADAKGNKSLEVRLGGIYSLERIARDSPEDLHWPIMEVLSAYVRENAHLVSASEQESYIAKAMAENRVPVQPPPDIQAILTVIGRRKPTYGAEEARRLDLHGTFLLGANFYRANLIGANLSGTNLKFTNLSEGHFENAFLNANLSYAHFQAAHLNGANFRGAVLTDADLRGTDLSEVLNLTQSQIDSATGDQTTKIPASLHLPDAWQKNR
jgi:hypothetical protein